MNIVEAVRAEQRIHREEPFANVEIRRAAWMPEVFVGVGDSELYCYASRASVPVSFEACVEDFIADDWEVNVIASPPEAA